MPRMIDLTAKKFGKWTAIAPTNKRHGSVVIWACKCDCGTLRDVDGNSLRKGESKSCGGPKCKIYRRNLIGQRFGKLIALQRSEKISKNGKIGTGYLCLCDCGNTSIVYTSNLTSGNSNACSQACGNTLPDGQAIINRSFRSQEQGAKIRGYEWDLTIDEYESIAKNPCIYCGAISTRTDVRGNRTLKLNSIDRKNNEPYYKVSNCQSVCFDCQTSKTDNTDLEFKNYIKRLIDFNK